VKTGSVAVTKNNTVWQCYSTGVTQDLRVLPMESKGSAELNPKMELNDISGH